MPIYEFECAACEAVFERLQKLSDPDPVDCPECGQPRVKRRLTAPAFRLAGSGWYETDFKKDHDKKRNLAGKDEAPKADAPKVEAKPEGKAADKAVDKAAPAAAPAAAAKPTGGDS
jgi:putative FmdB family regulatory protein